MFDKHWLKSEWGRELTRLRERVDGGCLGVGDTEMGEGEKVGPGGEWVGKKGTHGSPVHCHQNAAEGKNERVQ